jgi:hypothetical protein
MHLVFGGQYQMTVERLDDDNAIGPVRRKVRKALEEKERQRRAPMLVQRFLSMPLLACRLFLLQLGNLAGEIKSVLGS